MGVSKKWSPLFDEDSDFQKKIRLIMLGTILISVIGYALAQGIFWLRLLHTLEILWTGEFSRISPTLEIFLRRAPLFLILLVGIAGVSSYHTGSLISSSLPPAALVVGMTLAYYGTSPSFPQTPSGIILGFAVMIGLVPGIIGSIIGLAVRYELYGVRS